MKFDTAYNHCARYKSAVNDIYSAAKSYGSPHSWILSELKRRVYDDSAWAKCPRWVQQTVSDLTGFHLQDIYRNWVVWLFEIEDGKAVAWEKLTDEQRRTCTDNPKGFHYWLREVSDYGQKRQWETGANRTRQFVITDKKF